MQITQVLLYNSSSPVYINSTNLQAKLQVVIAIDGSLELGIVKNQIEKFDDAIMADFIRVANEKDKLTHCENCKYARTLLPEIKEEAKKLNLDMKIGYISTNFDRTKITINYTADDRVDFRELIKILGAKYKSRIEMRQIGNRDESKMIGALGVCGRETCCKSFLSDFDKIGVKMAKNQNIAPNPNRINGMCGRLLCCLKYEDEFYAEMQKKMPRIGQKINTPEGVGTVTSCDFLRETVTVSFTKDETTEIKTYPLDSIKN